jgi:dTDP-4-dehydrorhamnose reductase
MSLELWGGHECTVNRVGDRYRDQTLLTGHHDRIADLAAFAQLGVKALRYPVLWERVCPDSPDSFDWRWSDERLGELRRLGVRPIVGLIHHGSGPAWSIRPSPPCSPPMPARRPSAIRGSRTGRRSTSR